eukprot:scaffold2408_cov386-Prasinococcus_capsulatus_cf.AAC.11
MLREHCQLPKAYRALRRRRALWSACASLRIVAGPARGSAPYSPHRSAILPRPPPTPRGTRAERCGITRAWDGAAVTGLVRWTRPERSALAREHCPSALSRPAPMYVSTCVDGGWGAAGMRGARREAPKGARPTDAPA